MEWPSCSEPKMAQGPMCGGRHPENSVRRQASAQQEAGTASPAEIVEPGQEARSLVSCLLRWGAQAARGVLVRLTSRKLVSM
mmetsp:Transcript_100473/g.290236  ORF Transcript_100473/g.290236 Transcript_100473/m.290236 type:complete len:82 (+) Transcript_100473:1274-1519(+)